MDRFILAFCAILACLAVIFWSQVETCKSVRDLEGRIGLTEGKAILTPGRSCILNEETLSDESLAFQMTRACLRAYAEQSATTQEQ
jgi:hypothetical protein